MGHRENSRKVVHSSVCHSSAPQCLAWLHSRCSHLQAPQEHHFLDSLVARYTVLENGLQGLLMCLHSPQGQMVPVGMMLYQRLSCQCLTRSHELALRCC